MATKKDQRINRAKKLPLQREQSFSNSLKANALFSYMATKKDQRINRAKKLPLQRE
jgi:hypothetical protein